MNRLNRDTVIAIILMVFCGIFFWASFSIREPDYGVLPPSAWPRVVLVALSVLTVLYFVQSIRRTRTFDDSSSTAGKGLKHWFSIWQNPIWCFVLFFGYVASLPVLGMLIGGVTFVFLLQCVLGGWSPAIWLSTRLLHSPLLVACGAFLPLDWVFCFRRARSLIHLGSPTGRILQ